MSKSSDDGAARYNRKVVLILGLVAALVTLVVYLPALRNGFVNWDDHAYVYDNLNIRTIDLALFKWAFTSQVAALWHPFTMLSLAFDYAVWGLNPFGFHLTNIVLHSVNTALVFLLSLRLFVLAEVAPLDASDGGGVRGYSLKVVAASLVATLLFGLHPIHVESVVWISERKDVLSTLFFLLSILAYLGYASGGPGRRSLKYAASLILFLFALMSKPMAISLPLVLLLIDFYPLRRFLTSTRDLTGLRRAMVEKIPFFALMCVFVFITFWAHELGGRIFDTETSPFIERISVAVRGYTFYLYKMMLPVKLAPFYIRYLKTSIFDLWFVLSLAPLLVITAICVYTFNRGKAFIALWFYYLITLLPVIGLVQVSRHAAADRYVYIPSVALFLILGALVAHGIGSNRGVLRWVTVVVSTAVCIVMAILTLAQTPVWKDSVSLWTHEIKLYPVSEAYRNRADAYYLRKDYRRSIEDYTTIIDDEAESGIPRSLDYYKRGAALQDMGLPVIAIKDFNRALAIDPDSSLVYIDRAEAYKELGEFEMAVSDLTRAMDMNSPDAIIYNNRGNVYRALGELRLAIEDFDRAITLNPGLAVLYFNRGAALMDAGESEEAVKNIRRAAAMGLAEAEVFLRRQGLD